LTNLINDIIDITKIDSGTLKVQKTEVELNKLLQELKVQYSKIIGTSKVKLNIDIDLNSNIRICTDKYRLKQILMNLLSNAIKFTKKGFVKFGYEILDKNKLKIYVKDTGIGISKDNLKIIFNRFAQFGQPGSKNKGAGLGLPISKSLIEILGYGDLKFDSELDKGSTFYFEVPYAIKDDIYVSENTEEDELIDLTGINILIIEDDENFIHILRSYLKATNCKIFVSDGNKVLETIKKNKINLVLLDLGLGDIDGYKVLKDVKSHNKNIVVIVQSAYAVSEFRKKAYDLGADDFLSKPITKNQMLNSISKLI
jgi:CheY-like chemotaxis protein